MSVPAESPEDREGRLNRIRRTISAVSGKPLPTNSLVASAQRITGEKIESSHRSFGQTKEWQRDAWDMYDLVGELRFLATTLAGRMAQAKFYVGRVSDNPMESPEPVDLGSHLSSEVFSSFGESPAARAQLVYRMGVNLFVPGDGYFVGIPSWLMPHSKEEPRTSFDVSPLTSLGDLEWRMLSVSEVKLENGRVTLVLGGSTADQISVDPDEIFLIRCWRSHPRLAFESDSPTRSSLPVLRELQV